MEEADLKLLAALLGARIRGTSIYRTIIFTPTILSVVIIGFVWKKVIPFRSLSHRHWNP